MLTPGDFPDPHGPFAERLCAEKTLVKMLLREENYSLIHQLANPGVAHLHLLWVWRGSPQQAASWGLQELLAPQRGSKARGVQQSRRGCPPAAGQRVFGAVFPSFLCWEKKKEKANASHEKSSLMNASLQLQS